MALEMNFAGQNCALIYALHSGSLYGTERMALYTASGLADRFKAIFLAPPGPLLEAASDQGFQTLDFSSARQFSSHIRFLLSQHQRLAFIGTGVMHSALCLAWNTLYRRRMVHLHLVHGGACEKLSYSRKKLLNGFPVTFVAVSEYVRQRLSAHGVRPSQIRVIENFLPTAQVAKAPRRPAFDAKERTRIIVISRLDPEKQVGVLLDALAQADDLNCFDVRVFGTGWDFAKLQQRSRRANMKVSFEGFSGNVRQALSESDLLLHLCPSEPFGLAILEAFAAGVPALVPDTGGAASLVEEGRSGFHFQAGSAANLAQCLRRFLSLTADALNSITAEARRDLKTRFAEEDRIADYRRLLLRESA